MTTPVPAPILAKNDPKRTTGRFTGIYPNNTYPLVAGKIDAEQERRKQARTESTRTKRVASATTRVAHPPLTKKFPNDFVKRQKLTAKPGVS